MQPAAFGSRPLPAAAIEAMPSAESDKEKQSDAEEPDRDVLAPSASAERKAKRPTLRIASIEYVKVNRLTIVLRHPFLEILSGTPANLLCSSNFPCLLGQSID